MKWLWGVFEYGRCWYVFIPFPFGLLLYFQHAWQSSYRISKAGRMDWVAKGNPGISTFAWRWNSLLILLHVQYLRLTIASLLCYSIPPIRIVNESSPNSTKMPSLLIHSLLTTQYYPTNSTSTTQRHHHPQPSQHFQPHPLSKNTPTPSNSGSSSLHP